MIGRNGAPTHVGAMTESDLDDVEPDGIYTAPKGPLGTTRWAWVCPRCRALYARTDRDVMVTWVATHTLDCPAATTATGPR